MSESLRKAFEKENIEYFAALPIEECRVTRQELIDRAGIDARSVIVYLVPYYTGDGGNLSLYAVSRDYHIALREISDRVISALEESFPGARCRGFGDHSPIDERDAALKCSLGILGANGLVINRKYGSYVFIGEIVTDIEPSLLNAVAPAATERCDMCGACRSACPTGILRRESELCLSEITQRKGELDSECVELMRKFDTVWGCDLCQRVCPYNKEPKITPVSFFHEERIPILTTDVLNNMSKEEFAKRAFSWRGKKTVLRNLELLKY